MRALKTIAKSLWGFFQTMSEAEEEITCQIEPECWIYLPLSHMWKQDTGA